MNNNSADNQYYYLWMLLGQRELKFYDITAWHVQILSIIDLIGRNATPADNSVAASSGAPFGFRDYPQDGKGRPGKEN